MNKKDLFNTMETIVSNNTLYYQSDFNIDKISIIEWNKPFKAIWQVRDYGTNLTRITNNWSIWDKVSAPYNCMNVLHTYVISFNGVNYSLNEVSQNEVMGLLKSQPVYHVDFYLDLYEWHVESLRGTFDNMDTCEDFAENHVIARNYVTYNISMVKEGR